MPADPGAQEIWGYRERQRYSAEQQEGEGSLSTYYVLGTFVILFNSYYIL